LKHELTRYVMIGDLLDLVSIGKRRRRHQDNWHLHSWYYGQWFWQVIYCGYLFQVKAFYPVKAKGVTSTAYSYYKPDIKGEVLSAAVTVK
jgi:hypothetical protein